MSTKGENITFDLSILELLSYLEKWESKTRLLQLDAERKLSSTCIIFYRALFLNVDKIRAEKIFYEVLNYVLRVELLSETLN